MIIAAVTPSTTHGSAASCVVPPPPQLPPTWKRRRKTSVKSGGQYETWRSTPIAAQLAAGQTRITGSGYVTVVVRAARLWDVRYTGGGWNGSAGGMGGAAAECLP